MLVSIRARPLVGGRVSLTSGGSIEYWFGKPTGEGFGPGAKVASKQLQIALASGGTRADEVSAPPGRAALEPNCPLEEAVRAAQAAGVPLGVPLAVAYDLSERFNRRPVWRIKTDGSEGTARTLDGSTCAILVR